MEKDYDYPHEDINRWSSRTICASCGLASQYIDGDIYKHGSGCSWAKKAKELVEAKKEIEILRLRVSYFKQLFESVGDEARDQYIKDFSREHGQSVADALCELFDENKRLKDRLKKEV